MGRRKFRTGAWWRRGVVDFVVHGGRALSIAFDILWGAGQMALGVGILRLRPAARLIALIYCWFTFALFPFRAGVLVYLAA